MLFLSETEFLIILHNNTQISLINRIAHNFKSIRIMLLFSNKLLSNIIISYNQYKFHFYSCFFHAVIEWHSQKSHILSNFTLIDLIIIIVIYYFNPTIRFESPCFLSITLVKYVV